MIEIFLVFRASQVARNGSTSTYEDRSPLSLAEANLTDWRGSDPNKLNSADEGSLNGPGNHHVVAFVKPNDPNETYREDHYTNKGVLDHKDPFRCWPTGTQPTVAYNAPEPNPNSEDRQADQSRTAGAEPPEAYSIVEVAHDSKGCRPAHSDNCITLTGPSPADAQY
jgi:hypothetical protein